MSATTQHPAPGVDGHPIGTRVPRARWRPVPPIPAELLASPAAREMMAARDVAAIYQLLQRYGVSQRRIAAMTGQSQSEISEILKGRKVQTVDVLEAIADGLNTPRSWWRLTGELPGRVDAAQAALLAKLLAQQLAATQATVSALLVALGRQ